MSVDKPERLVPDNVWFGINSGSWIYGPSNCEQPEKIKLSLNPKDPPPQDMLNGTPTCFSFKVFNSLGIISSKFSIIMKR